MAFDTLSTKYKQTIFFKDNGQFVEPAEIKDPQSDDIIGYIVPFKPKLINLLSMPENEILDNNDKDILHAKNLKTNFSDGSYIKEMTNKVHLYHLCFF